MQQSQSTDEGAEVSTGAITGRIINENGQPLPNAAVLVRGFGSAGPSRTEYTDSEGRFEVARLDRVAYLVSATNS